MLVIATLLLLAAASPAAAAEGESAGDPVSDASTAPPALAAVIELLRRGMLSGP